MKTQAHGTTQGGISKEGHGVSAVNGQHEWEITPRLYTRSEATAIADEFNADPHAIQCGTRYHVERYAKRQGWTRTA